LAGERRGFLHAICITECEHPNLNSKGIEIVIAVYGVPCSRAVLLYMNSAKNEEVTIATTRITVPPHSRKEFFQSISTLADRIRGDEGCLSYRLYEESGDENSLILVEEWKSPVLWAAHRNGKNFSVLLGVISVLSIAEKIDFKLLLQVGGNEVISNS